MLQCAAFAGPPGPAFSFSACPLPVSLTSPSYGKTFFLSPRFASAPGFGHNWLSQLQQGRSGALLVSVSLLIPQNCKQGRTRAFSCPGHVIPHFPLRGKAGLFPKMRCPSLPDSLTTAPHGFNRVGTRFTGVRFLYPAPKIAHKPTQGRVSVSPSFSGTLFLWQRCQLLLQLVIYCLLNRPDGKLQGAVSHLAGLGAHLGWLHLDE